MKNYNFRLIYKKHKNIRWILPSIFWALLFGLVITLICGYFLGYRAFTVLGHSSEPDIHYGSVAIDFKVPYDELKVGDYVTWTRTGNAYVTHRIIEITSPEHIVTCQTDLYADGPVTPDAPVTYKQIKGKVIFSIPKLGSMIYGVRNLIISSNGGLNILGLMTIVLVGATFYFFKRLLYVETFTLKEY